MSWAASFLFGASSGNVYVRDGKQWTVFICYGCRVVWLCPGLISWIQYKCIYFILNKNMFIININNDGY